jgi:hypothetical protein
MGGSVPVSSIVIVNVLTHYVDFRLERGSSDRLEIIQRPEEEEVQGECPGLSVLRHLDTMYCNTLASHPSACVVSKIPDVQLTASWEDDHREGSTAVVQEG